MTYNFEYAGLVTYTGQYDVEDISQCTLKCDNGADKCWFISIQTELGECSIKQLGPVYQDGDNYNIYYYYNFMYNKIQYSEKKLISTINKFLNNGEVQNVCEITTEEFDKILRGLKDVEYR